MPTLTVLESNRKKEIRGKWKLSDLVPGQIPFGKEVFKAISQEMKQVRIKGTSEIQEIQVLGDWAYLRNYLEMTIIIDAVAKKVDRIAVAMY